MSQVGPKSLFALGLAKSIFGQKRAKSIFDQYVLQNSLHKLTIMVYLVLESGLWV
jgi:hypothetical protein